MKYTTFEGDYDDAEFYALMGKFFAEREYQNEMPYLVNEEGRVWIVAVDSGVVEGFTTYIVRSTKIDFGYTYVLTDEKLKRKLNEKRSAKVADVTKPIEVFTTNGDVHYWREQGFEITKETKNYTFLRKEVVKDERED